ncbi:hypothetical protein [Clostridium sp. JS66]|uniref:hypothetical protein n=1 Tax=Clostridium sp. JS66 TaxID=3064705 RepID=UPI00298DB318|nr:hypothetical protein [Clostridium sp. JS66]WPC42938.1 hypothetical protein Q6H37_05555 [Clostridium sp. JS66]
MFRNCIAIPYKNFKEKMRIINTEFKNKKFMDLDGVLYHVENNGIFEEESVWNLCWRERAKVN